MLRCGCLTLLACLASLGCAHHQANQYTYAPPLAPPVYPQPQQVASPVMQPALPGTVPAAGVVPGPMPASGPVTSAVECCPPLEAGTIMATPVVYEAGQTPPCPPGP